MPLFVELVIISVNIAKYVSTESIRTFTGIQELMADFFLFKDFMTFFTFLGDTSFKWNFSAIVWVELLVINLIFSFRIILLVSKLLSGKKGLIFFQNFLLSFRSFYIDYKSIHFFFFWVSLCKNFFFSCSFPSFYYFEFSSRPFLI